MRSSSDVVYIYSSSLCEECDRIPPVKNRASMVHALIESFGLLKYLNIKSSKPALSEDLRLFHSEDYINFLKREEDEGNEDDDITDEQLEYGLGYDCLPVPNLFTLVCAVAGGSLSAAEALMGGSKVAIHWGGGWHHAQRDEAEGFCYINDIAIAIQKLRQSFQKVLYIDLDIHHGNGVENAFAFSRHIFTLSFHRNEPGFYPNSGDIKSVGLGNGRGYTANVPLKEGISGENYCILFHRIFSKVFDSYRPDVIVVQCGGDGLAGDSLGGANLVLEDLGFCVQQILLKDRPTMLLGGGGYHRANTSRLWAYLTSIAVGRPLDLNADIPEHDYFPQYGPSFELRVPKSLRSDPTTKKEVHHLITTVSYNLEFYKVGNVQ